MKCMGGTDPSRELNYNFVTNVWLFQRCAVLRHQVVNSLHSVTFSRWEDKRFAVEAAR